MTLHHPLEGLLVLDLSRALAGPYCTMILGDLGADVIKVEHPTGDDTRRWGPPFDAGESAYFLAFNRNKRSVVADLKTGDGAALVRRIARSADILVENFLPGAMDAFGLPLAQLRAENPRLITLSISGMGADGPDAGQPGYDFVLQALGGIMSITGAADGPPSKVGVPIVDLTTGMMAANAVQAALYSRERRGAGQHIDISLLETHVSWLGNVASAFLMTGDTPQRMGNAHATIVPYQTFAAQDGEFALGVANDGQWLRLCAAMTRADLAQDPRFATNPERVHHRAVLVALLDAHFASGRVEEWVKLAQQAGVPVGRVRTLPEVLSDPQVLHRDMVQTVQHPGIGELKLVGVPFKFSTDHASIRRAPPLLGEHTAEINALFPA